MKEPAAYTAAIATADVLGDYCDVAVIKNDDEGGLTDEIVMAATELPVRIDDPDVLGQVETAAEKALAQAGWQVYGPWRVADYALYADAEPSRPLEGDPS